MAFRLTQYSATIQIAKAGCALLSALVITGCGGGSERPCGVSADACVIASPPPVEIWWDAPLPDFTENRDRPTVAIVGSRTQILALNEEYLEEGATAVDDQDGDLSSSIIISGQVNSSAVGDYLIRYSVTDSSGLDAIEQIKIVRVMTGAAESLSRRPLGSTMANFGYLEHLPLDYGQTTGSKPPLLIYLAGSGANAQFAGTTDPTLALEAIIGNFGVPKIIEENQWDNTLPFVVLAPLLGAVPSAEYNERIDALVEFAIRAYDIDTDRVYMTGWSNGGFIAYDYTINFPQKIAAVIPMSSGLPYDIDSLPDNFCGIENVPVWLFHGTSDETIPFINTIDAYNATLDNCQPGILPKVSLISRGEHAIHQSVFDLSALAGGSADAQYDTRFSLYDVSVYEWLLRYSLANR
jgi:predicted esterase